jgi:DNA-directed RNA polymerase subunit RPC12/RpoP
MITDRGQMYQIRLERCILCSSTMDSREGRGIFCCRCSSRAVVRIKLEFLAGGYKNQSAILYRSQIRTGRGGICIAVIQRRDGLVHFEFDLWRVDWELRDEVCANLYELWRQEVSGSLATLGKRKVEATFGKTYTHFDVLPESAAKWKAILIAVLSTNVALEFMCIACGGAQPSR